MAKEKIQLVAPPRYDAKRLFNSRLFQFWWKDFSAELMKVDHVEFKAISGSTDDPFFLTIEVVGKEDNKPKVFTVFLRFDSVAVIILIDCVETGERYILLAQQMRPAICSSGFVEAPAGTVNKKDGVVGRMMAEIQEETGLAVSKSDLYQLGEWYPSCGGCSEKITGYLTLKKMGQRQIQGILQKTHGVAEEGEEITLVLLPIREFCRRIEHGEFSDGKILSLIALLVAQYNSLAIIEALQNIR